MGNRPPSETADGVTFGSQRQLAQKQECFAMRWHRGAYAVLMLAIAGVAWAQLDVTSGLSGLAKVRDGVSRRASSYDHNWREGNGDAWYFNPGETRTIADLEGPGVITHIWNTISAPEPRIGHLLKIRMYWDDEEQPSVETPLSDFFVIGHGLNIPFESIPVAVSAGGLARNCFWPMPFRKHARITITNESKTPVNAFYFYIDWQKLKRMDRKTAYFHARYRQEYPADISKRYLLADIEGRGHYVGTVMNVRSRQPSWIGEGDDFFFVDGGETPTMYGTGTEDYFCDAWGFREFDMPFYGVPLFEGFETGDRTSVYRWHIADPVRFQKSLRVEIEHVGPTLFATDGTSMGYGQRPDDVASVSYWYQLEPHKPWEPIPEGEALFYPEDPNLDPFTNVFEPASRTNWINYLLAHRPNALDVIWLEQPRLTGVFTSAITVVNPFDAPAKLNLAFSSNDGLDLSTATHDVDLPAKGAVSTDVVLEAATPVFIGAVQPITVNVDMLFNPAQGEPLDISTQSTLVIDAPFECAMRGKDVRIDGELNEWPELPFVMTRPCILTGTKEHWTGPEDSSFEFAVARDATFVYIAIRVTDDVGVYFPELHPWQQDGLEVRLTALPDERRASWMGKPEFGSALLLAFCPVAEGTAAMKLYEPGQIPAGVQAVSKQTATGYVAEIAVPHAVLDAQYGGSWKAFRLNIAVDDVDDPLDPAVNQLWWRPDWRTDVSYDNSGTFYRK